VCGCGSAMVVVVVVVGCTGFFPFLSLSLLSIGAPGEEGGCAVGMDYYYKGY